MKTSIEKIHDLVAEYSGPPKEDDEGLELAMRTAVMTVGPLFLPMLPDDPNYLDAALEQMAIRLLAMRSDGCRQVQLVDDVDGSVIEQAELPETTS